MTTIGKPTYEELEKKCALQQSKLAAINELMSVVEKASDIAKAGIEELQSQNADLAVQLANAESKCRELAAENVGLKNFIINDCHVAHIEPETFYEEEITVKLRPPHNQLRMKKLNNRRVFNVNHLMIDLETMGTKPNAPVVAIGAVFFDPLSGELGPEYYTAVNLASAMEQGAVPDGDTIIWWLKQSPEARSAICVDDTLPIAAALSELSHFINRNTDPKFLKVWGNGATFDNTILRSAYERAGQPCPWQFWNDSDVRTIVLLGRQVGFDPKREMPFDGVAHNALADARHQAKYVTAIWQKLIPATSNN